MTATRQPGRRTTDAHPRPATARAAFAVALGAALLAAGGTVQPIAPARAATTGVVIEGQAAAASGSSRSASYAFLSQQGSRSRIIARWNPCVRAIGYRVNSRGGRSGATADVIGAMARIRAATGLPLVYRGQTRIVPGASRSAYPKDTQIVVAWARPGTTRYLPRARSGGSVAGQGGGAWTSARDARGRPWGQFVSGFAVLNSSVRLTAGFGRGPATGWQGTRGQLLMHELGHVVGLDHAKSRSQIMYPTMTRKLAVYGSGDRAGLRTLGRASGCLYR